MMSFDFSPGRILIEAFVGLFAFFSEGIRITVNPFQNEDLLQTHPDSGILQSDSGSLHSARGRGKSAESPDH